MAWIHDHLLIRKDVKYFYLPAFEALPLVITTLWIALGHKTFWADPKSHFDGYSTAWLIPLATLIGGGIASASNALMASSNERVADLLAAQQQLLRLVGHVRVIVSAKSRRFAEALRTLTAPVDAGKAFLTITRPDEQIREIIRNTFDYFFHSPENSTDETIVVILLRWNDLARHLEFAEWFPATERPKTSETEFGDMSTIAGRAFHSREMVISENLATDPRYKKLSDSPTGSMFAYPMWDDSALRVAFVINVVSSKIQRFREADRKVLDIPMRVFGERLLLEHRLLELRGRVAT